MRKFTLLELLVVLAIIGILITLLIPSLSKARQAGFYAVCTSNMKQLGVATISYVKENSGLYMSNWKDDNWADEGRLGPVDDSSWHYKLKDYLSLTMTGKGQYRERIPNVLQCPSEPKSYKDNSVRTYNSYKFTRRHGDAKNQPGIITRNSTGKKNIATISNPGETVAAVEGLQQGFINVVGGSVAEPGDYNLFQGAVADDPYLFPHKSQNMYTLWVDNHVNQVHRNKVFDTEGNTDPNNPQGTLWDSER